MMKIGKNNRNLVRFSFLLNGIFIFLVFFFVFRYYEEIHQKYLEKKGKAEIVFYGDSHIKNGNWNDLLNERSLKKNGYPGFTTLQLKEGIQKKVVDYHPKICVLEVGTNDVMLGIPLATIKRNYQSMIESLDHHKIQPIVTSVIFTKNDLNGNHLRDSLNLFLKVYCKDNAIPYVDLNSKLSKDFRLNEKYTHDGTHLNEPGYRIWSEEIKKVIQKK